jgi:hypothetical protein
VDYAQLVKLYDESPDAEKRYGPAICIGARKMRIEGNPNPRHVSTSYAERQNLNSLKFDARRQHWRCRWTSARPADGSQIRPTPLTSARGRGPA